MLQFKWYTARVKVPIKYTLSDVPHKIRPPRAASMSVQCHSRTFWSEVFSSTTIYISRENYVDVTYRRSLLGTLKTGSREIIISSVKLTLFKIKSIFGVKIF